MSWEIVVVHNKQNDTMRLHDVLSLDIDDDDDDDGGGGGDGG